MRFECATLLTVPNKSYSIKRKGCHELSRGNVQYKKNFIVALIYAHKYAHICKNVTWQSTRRDNDTRQCSYVPRFDLGTLLRKDFPKTQKISSYKQGP